MPAKLKPVLAAAILLSSVAGCGGANLGQIDETPDDREEMAGPGIFAGEDGETALKWKIGDKPAPADTEARGTQLLDEKAEFELFKQWNRLRTEGADSEEYREFRQWIEYREFKAGQ